MQEPESIVHLAQLLVQNASCSATTHTHTKSSRISHIINIGEINVSRLALL